MKEVYYWVFIWQQGHYGDCRCRIGLSNIIEGNFVFLSCYLLTTKILIYHLHVLEGIYLNMIILGVYICKYLRCI